jgi:hypothetical protein
MGSDNKLYPYDPAIDTNHMLGVCMTKSDVDQPAIFRLSGLGNATCNGGCTAQDRLMPSAGGSVGQVELWSPGNVTAGFAIQNAAPGDLVVFLLHHEIP